MPGQVRIDKWLWAVRLFKTRSLATEECQKGHVSIGGLPVKPSRMVNHGDVVKVRKPPIYRTYKILDTAEKRMPAKEVPGFLEDITPKEELELLEMHGNMKWITRERGTGRPTKKERRDLDDIFEF
jgi:ribosome-associated heat shock protein Hsp15